jgi:putative salt-induced outer membrane protein YdiY
MEVVRNRLFCLGLMVLLGGSPFCGAGADVLALRSGEKLGGPEASASLARGSVTMTHPSGSTTVVPLEEVVSLELEQPRQLKLKNGDLLHVEDVVFSEEQVGFTSEVLGETTIPRDFVVSVSPPPAQEERAVAGPEAEKIPSQPAKKWSGKLQLGYTGSTGREDSQSVNFATEAVRETSKDRLTLRAAARYGDTDGEKDVDSQEASGKYDQFMTERTFWYASLGALRDSINLIDLRLSPGVGVGRKFITGDKVSLEGELGLTWIWERQNLLSGEKETDSNWYGRVGGCFTWKIAPGAEFSEELEFLPGLSSTDEFRARSISQITATLTKRLSLAAGFTIDYDNDPAEGVPRTSTNASTGLILSY